MSEKIVLRIVSALVMIVAIAGIAFFAYQAGVAQGSPVTINAPSGDGVPMPQPYYGYGYGMRYFHPFGFGIGCFGPLLALFLFLLAMRAFRFAFWGPRWGWRRHMHEHGPWSKHWEDGAPPMFTEWHKRAHGEQPEDKKE